MPRGMKVATTFLDNVVRPSACAGKKKPAYAAGLDIVSRGVAVRLQYLATIGAGGGAVSNL
jgi:hypothetical protein